MTAPKHPTRWENLSPLAEAKIPVQDLDPFEWLAIESLWATTKTSFDMRRHMPEPDIRDRNGFFGRLISGNLDEANPLIDNAHKFFGDKKREILGEAAWRLGRLAGGLISVTTHLRTPAKFWGAPVKRQTHYHFDAVDEVLRRAESAGRVARDPEYYYGLLEPVNEALGETKPSAEDDQPDPTLLSHSEASVRASMAATTTWLELIGGQPDLLIDPPAISYSQIPYIEDLRKEFESKYQLISEVRAVAEKRSRNQPF